MNIGNYLSNSPLGTGTILIDNQGQQYEKIQVTRGAEIAQTDLYPEAMREGAIFFERLKGDRSLKKLILNVNGETLEILLDVSN